MNFSDSHKKLYKIILSHSGLSFSELLVKPQFNKEVSTLGDSLKVLN